MMAFFLLMWLMEATTEEQRGAISEYFNNPSDVQGSSPVPAPTPVQGPGGASTSMIKLGGGMELHHDAAPPAPIAPPTPGVQTQTRPDDDGAQDEKLDNERLAGLLNELKKAIDERESLAKYKDQILLDVTPEGVRIQIIDHERRSMFPLGSARLEDFSSDILKELAHIVSGVPNRISISGHTDRKPYVAVNYTNWELSADRANAAPPRTARRRTRAGKNRSRRRPCIERVARSCGTGESGQSPHQHRGDEQAHRSSHQRGERQSADGAGNRSGACAWRGARGAAVLGALTPLQGIWILPPPRPPGPPGPRFGMPPWGTTSCEACCRRSSWICCTVRSIATVAAAENPATASASVLPSISKLSGTGPMFVMIFRLANEHQRPRRGTGCAVAGDRSQLTNRADLAVREHLLAIQARCVHLRILIYVHRPWSRL
jgi:flagellar motor protein MotB